MIAYVRPCHLKDKVLERSYDIAMESYRYSYIPDSTQFGILNVYLHGHNTLQIISFQ